MSLCLNQLYKVKLAWRRFLAGRKGVKLGLDVRLGPGVDLDRMGQRSPDGREFHKGNISLGEETRVERGAILWAFGGLIRTGRNVFLGPYVTIYGHGGVEIGDQTLVSMHATILSSNHGTAGRDREIRHQPDILLPTKIGRDCWIGANAVILGGVTIGDGSVVGAGAVVTKDLPAYSVAMGVPAKVVRTRT